MKTMKLKWLFLLPLFWVACSDHGESGPGLSSDRTSLTLKKEEDTQAVYITCNGEWQAACPEADTWCSVMKIDATKLVVMAEANDTPRNRSTTVTVTCGDRSVSIEVVQTGEIRFVITPEEEIRLRASGEEMRYVISSNGEWTCRVDDPRFKIAKIVDTLRISADTSYSPDGRNTVLHFDVDGQKDYLNLPVVQNAYIDPEISTDLESDYFYLDPGEHRDIKIDSKLPWTARIWISPYDNITAELIKLDDGTLRLNVTGGTMGIFYLYINAGDMEYAKELLSFIYVGFPH